jgi:hydroxypyruvate reductase
MAELLSHTTERDLVLALISGGGSALLELLQPGLGLADLQSVNAQLLRCGAAIHEINTIRKRLSRIKGGGLLRLAHPARVLGLILSDVVGNPLDLIASGPTVAAADDSRGGADEVASLIAKHRLAEVLPDNVLRALYSSNPSVTREGAAQSVAASVENRLIASNRLAGEAAAQAARRLGFNAHFIADDWQGEAREVGRRFAALLPSPGGRGVGGEGELPACFIVGGESTVTVRGGGKGGRNQEVALSAALAIAGRPNVVIAALATDGIDGPTEAAGAVVTGDTVARARALSLDPQRCLDDNDAYPFFSALGDLIVTGPTGTNVNDLTFGLVYESL